MHSYGLYTFFLLIFVAGTIVFAIRSFRHSRAKKRILKQYLDTTFIIDHLRDGIVEYDQNFIIERINPVAGAILGVSETDVIGRKIEETDRNDAKYSSIAKVMFPGGKGEGLKTDTIYEQIDVSITKPEERHLKVFTVPKVKKLGENPDGFVKIIKDVSRDDAVTKTKTDLVAIVSHQLRTPLAGVKWILKALLDGDFGQMSPEQRELINRGYAANESMIALIDDMLDVAKIEKEEFIYIFTAHEIVEFIRDIIKSHYDEARVKNITIEENYGVEKLMVTLDQKRMRIALGNILDNAINYSREGGKITVGVTADSARVTIRITDTGIGIPEAARPSIFTKFFRAENASRVRTRGTGLGLFLVKAIVDGHGGEVTFESKEGGGTTFYVRIPINQPGAVGSEIALTSEEQKSR